MKRFLLLTKAMILTNIRQPQILFWNIVFPVFILFIYKFVFGANVVDGVGYMNWVVPGVIALNIISYGLVGTAAMTSDMRERGMLRRIKATPTPPLQLFGAFMVNNIIVCLLQSAVVLVTAVLFFGMRPTAQQVLMAVPAIFVSTTVFVALGQAISSLTPKMGIALAIGQTIYFAQMFIANLVIPIDQLPAWLASIAKWLPAYGVAELVRGPFLHNNFGAQPALNLAVLLAYTLLAGFVAARWFRWEPKA
jgi:ABC-2 type transport system permease protein